MPARVLVVGLDSGDAELLESLAAEGSIPSFTALTRGAAAFSLENTLRTLPGGIWPEFTSGRSYGVAGFYFPPRQLRTGETVPCPVERDEVDPQAFWTVASDAGKRVAVVDMPWSVPPSGLNGVYLGEWGTHDHPFGMAGDPPGLVDELLARHGDYPVWRREYSSTRAACDTYDATLEQYERLLDDLLEGIAKKQELFLDLLGREEWDLFVCAFGEPQCVGHQFWHFHEGRAEHASAASARLRSAVRDVHIRIDEALGALAAAAGDGATVVIFASHGMTEPKGGPQLLAEVLVRLGLGSGRGVAANVRSRLPIGVRALARRVVPHAARRHLQAAAASLPTPLESPATRAVALDGDRVGWIRLNLKGREPYGAVAEGAEADATVEEVRTALLELADPETGETIVEQVTTAEEAFGPRRHPDVPDLMVDFREDVGRIDACRSERIGLIRQAYRPPAHRTGAHPARPSWLWIAGQTAPTEAGGESVLDIAPTVLALLGVPAPEWMAGRPLIVASG